MNPVSSLWFPASFQSPVSLCAMQTATDCNSAREWTWLLNFIYQPSIQVSSVYKMFCMIGWLHKPCISIHFSGQCRLLFLRIATWHICTTHTSYFHIYILLEFLGIMPQLFDMYWEQPLNWSVRAGMLHQAHYCQSWKARVWGAVIIRP